MDEGSRPNGGRGLNETPAEVIERECPVVIEAFGFVPDTGGPGKYRGGLSIYRRWRFLLDGHIYMRYYHLRARGRKPLGGRPSDHFL